jgi:hypothetical protein
LKQKTLEIARLREKAINSGDEITPAAEEEAFLCRATKVENIFARRFVT